MRRAVISIPSNIAEGASRISKTEWKRFFEIARSSLVEIDTQIEISFKLGYCSPENITSLIEKMNHIFALLSRLIDKTK